MTTGKIWIYPDYMSKCATIFNSIYKLNQSYIIKIVVKLN